MTTEDDLLKEKARLLIVRERELLAIKRKHKRLALWLTLTQQLPQLADPAVDLPTACHRVAERMMSVLDLNTVAFFRIEGASLHPFGDGAENQIQMDPAGRALIEGEPAGMCVESGGEAQGALSRALGLARFLWHRVEPARGSPLLFVAGHDRERAPFYAPFDDEDLAHFSNTAHQLTLLLGNNNLVRELERDKQRLQEFNIGLERQVRERTQELAGANAELERAVGALREKDRLLQEDIEEARLFQEKILPELPRSLTLDFAVAYRPLERVGGDLFDIVETRPGDFRVFVADATGHGVQGAMRTILIKSEFDRVKNKIHAPNVVLQELGDRLTSNFPGGETMCTGCCIDIAPSENGAMRVAYANAGGPPILHWSGDSVAEIYGETPFLGVGHATWPEPIAFRMAPGDLLLVASDGLVEQQNERGVPFEAVVKAAPVASATSAANFLERLLGAFEAFRGAAPLSDDLTLIAIRARDTTARH